MSQFSDSPFRHLTRSPWTRWVGFRYLKSKKSSSFLSFITLLSMVGVGLGVTAMIVVLSVMDGFEDELKKRLMTSDLHIMISPTAKLDSFDNGFVKADAILKTKAKRFFRDDPDIKHVWPILSTEAILRNGRRVTGVVMKGISDKRFKVLEEQMVETATASMLAAREESHGLPGMVVGQEMAYLMGLIPGDIVTIISPIETEGMGGNIPRMKRYVVEGVYRSGIPEQESHVVFLRKKHVASFLRKRKITSHWEVVVKDFEKAPDVANRLREILPGYRVKDWIQLNSNLFFSLRLERIAMFSVLAVIVIVASFNIVTTLTMMVIEKVREVSILRAMGATQGQVGAIFLAEGFFIGAIGVGGGLFASWLICMLLRRYQFITLPDIYYDTTLPVTFEPLYYAGVGGCAVLIVLLACFYPSRRASKLNPIHGIRLN